MKNRLYALLFMCAAIVGCSDDDSDSGTITYDIKGLFVEAATDIADTPQTTVVATFTYDNVESIYVSSYPDGWDVSVSLENCTVTATSPDLSDADNEEEGTIYVYGYTKGGNTVSSSFYVGVVEFIDLDDQMANSVIIDKHNVVYHFDPKFRGETYVSSAPAAEDCFLEWRTSYGVINYVQMYGDRIMFYVSYDSYDLDDDDEYDDMPRGNAVISALSGNDSILWSWHFWVTDQLGEVVLDGKTYMDRNLGAFYNGNEAADGNTATENIYYSYGLYYQWGRKDPFIYPSSYNASGGDSGYIYDGDSTSATPTFEDTTATKGNIAYSWVRPNTFLCGNTASNYDWLYGTSQNDGLWGSGTTKSIYDPSPKGWRVPSAADLQSIVDLGVGSVGNYGTTFGSETFMAYGVRTYFNGKIQNLSSDPNDQYAPWAGYYWSRDANVEGADYKGNPASVAKSLHFWSMSDDTVTVDDIDTPASPQYRSYGMQIRCVKDE